MSWLSKYRLLVVEPRKRGLETFESREIIAVNLICTTTTSLPNELPSIEKTVQPLDTRSLHLEFATRVFEASELDTVRTPNDTSLSPTCKCCSDMLTIHLSSGLLAFSSPCYLPYIACIASSSSEPKPALRKSSSYSVALTPFFTSPVCPRELVA